MSLWVVMGVIQFELHLIADFLGFVGFFVLFDILIVVGVFTFCICVPPSHDCVDSIASAVVARHLQQNPICWIFSGLHHMPYDCLFLALGQ